MKSQLEKEDCEALAAVIIEMLKPLLCENSKRDREDVLLDVNGLKDYLKVSKQWIYGRTHLKEIPHIKIDGQLRFRKRDIDKWLNSHSVPAVNVPVHLKAIK